MTDFGELVIAVAAVGIGAAILVDSYHEQQRYVDLLKRMNEKKSSNGRQ